MTCLANYGRRLTWFRWVTCLAQVHGEAVEAWIEFDSDRDEHGGKGGENVISLPHFRIFQHRIMFPLQAITWGTSFTVDPTH